LSQRVGIVVPTLGKRPEYLENCLRSIRLAGDAHIRLVAPESMNVDSLVQIGLVDTVAKDPGTGLPDAINAGLSTLPSSVDFINWLGDDDLLLPAAISVAAQQLAVNPEIAMVFGSCDYVDPSGQVVWQNKSGQWAVPLLRFGPDLIPQPGALFRRSLFERVGRLDPKFDWAFDFDLFIRLAKVGKLRFINKRLAQFRWHPESLSVEFRERSVSEASVVRRSHLPPFLKNMSPLWEYPVRQATLIAGARITARSKMKAIKT
jgi:hypothetical protein